MTLAELLDLARDTIGNTDYPPGAGQLASAILDLLAESAPCGWEMPHHVDPHAMPPLFVVPRSWVGEPVSPADARAMARMLLRAADAVER